MTGPRIAILLVPFLALSGSGCEPGFTYRIVEADGRAWSHSSQTIDKVTLTADAVSGRIGSEDVVMYAAVVNRSNDDVIIVGGELLTNDRVIEGRIVVIDPTFGNDRTIRPGTKQVLSLTCDLGGPAFEVLGTDMTWNWRVQMGPDIHTIRVQMKREQ